MPRLILLAGAPETTNLQWSEDDLLQRRPLSATSSTHNTLTLDLPSNLSVAQWRQLPEKDTSAEPLLPTISIDTETREEDDTAPAHFLTPEDLASYSPSANAASNYFDDSSNSTVSTTETTSEVLSDFYDQSLAVHEEIAASQLPGELDPPSARISLDGDRVESHPPSPSAAIRTPFQWPAVPAPQSQHLSDLEDIPNAAYLRSIEPQTMTVNIIVGILSIAPPRTVTTRGRWGREREAEVMELLVGDDTKTAFSITMWLPPEMHVNWKDSVHPVPDGHRSVLRKSLKLLRSRDIILLRNVALNHFRGKVHGQSLRRDVTKVDLLFRKRQPGEEVGGAYTARAVNSATEADQQLMKVKKVKDWMMNFVADQEDGETGPSRRKDTRKLVYGRRLPPDTQ